MSENRIFLDTNILIYAYDVSAGSKHDAAKTILNELWNSGTGILSTQVLSEFFINITRKIPKPIDTALAKTIIEDFLIWNVMANDGQAVLDAIDIHIKHKLSFWDSMIVQSAIQGKAEVLLTEDMDSGLNVSGVEIRNPFI